MNLLPTLLNLFTNKKRLTGDGRVLTEQRQKELSKEKYTARWWQQQVPNLALQKVVYALEMATRQGLCEKQESKVADDYKIYMPKNSEKEILTFLEKPLDKSCTM